MGDQEPSSGATAAGTAPDGLRDIQSITDAALSRLEPQALLDVLVERVKETLQADTAAVLLLDRPSGQLIATAASGLEEEVRQGVRIPLGQGFAGRIAALGRPVILDKVDQTRVVNPILLDQGIRSLMGAPLLADGSVIGVLHVGTLTGRSFTSRDADLLQLAADRAALAVQALSAQLDREAAVALQRSLVPSALPVVRGLEMAARYVPGSGDLGGDWYDAFPLPSGSVCAVIGDVTGTGLNAAVIMGRMRSVLRAYSLETDDPADVLSRLDAKMRHFEPDAMATVLCAIDQPVPGGGPHLLRRPPATAASPPGRGRPAGRRAPRRADRRGQPETTAGGHGQPAAWRAALPVHRRAGGTARPAHRRGHRPAARRAAGRRPGVHLHRRDGCHVRAPSPPRRHRPAHAAPQSRQARAIPRGSRPVTAAALDVGWTGRHAVVTMPEEIDLANAPAVRNALLALAEQAPELITADLTGTTFCDSAGVHAITRAHQGAVAQGGELRLAVGDSPVARILELTGLDQVIPVFRGVRQSLDTPREAAGSAS